MSAQVHAGKVLFTGLLLLASLTIGLKEVRFEDRLERLWVVEGGRLADEAAYLDETLGPGAGGVNQMVIQTGKARIEEKELDRIRFCLKIC